MSEPVHVLVLAGADERRAAIEQALGAADDIEIVAATDPADLDAATAEGYPDVVVLQAGPAELAGARSLARSAVATRFLAVVDDGDSATPAQLLDSNIGAVVHSTDALVSAVRGLARGEGFLDAPLARHVLDRHRDGSIGALSTTEEEVLSRLAEGAPVAAIADEYAVPERLVRLHAGGPLARLFTT